MDLWQQAGNLQLSMLAPGLPTFLLAQGRISAAELVQYIPHDILQSNGHADHLDVNDAMVGPNLLHCDFMSQ